MRFDQIINDLLDWVRRVLWSKKQNTQRPFKSIQHWRGSLGVLHQVERDTPRAVSTYIFAPFRESQTLATRDGKPRTQRRRDPFDIHIFLDILLPIDQKGKRTQRRGIDKMTHRVTVMRASHHLNPEDGSYQSDVLYSRDWDLQGNSHYRDRHAITIINQVVRMLLDKPDYLIDWETEIQSERKHIMGSDYPGTILPGGTITVTVRGV